MIIYDNLGAANKAYDECQKKVRALYEEYGIGSEFEDYNWVDVVNYKNAAGYPELIYRY